MATGGTKRRSARRPRMGCGRVGAAGTHRAVDDPSGARSLRRHRDSGGLVSGSVVGSLAGVGAVASRRTRWHRRPPGRPTAAANCSGVASAPTSAGTAASSSPSSSSASADQDAERGGVADHGDPGPARQRLVGQQQRGVEQLGEGVTRITPACSNSACTAGVVDRRPRGRECGVRSACRPHFTAITGLVRASRRASRANLRGLPKDSRYSRTTSVPGSVCQYCSRSLPETSARLPAETKVGQPEPALARPPPGSRCRARRTGRRSRPGPAAARRGEGGVEPHRRVGVRHAEGVRPDHPHAVRPGRRRPAAAAAARAVRPPSRRSPADITTSAVTPLARQASTTVVDAAPAGTATTARSTSSGMSVTDGVRPHALHGAARPG